MNRYTILRNNTESGPFTREELTGYGLTPTDLVWAEGESRAWQHPDNFPELQSLVSAGIRKPFPNVHRSTNLQVSAYSARAEYAKTYVGGVTQTGPVKAFTFETAKPRRHDFVLYSKLFGATAFLLIGAFTYFIGRQLIRQADERDAMASTAVEIKAESLPVSSTQHAAFAAATISAPLIASAQATMDSVRTLPPKKRESAQRKPHVVATADTSNEISAVNKPADAETKKEEAPAEEKPAPSAPVNITSAIQVSANNYKVGMFGGISDLELSVTNSAGVKAGKILVEVEYLKPNGNVVKSQTVAVENIAAGATKTVAVPASKRGVKIRYRVVSAEAAGD